MQLTQKHIITISIVAILAIVVGYIAIQNNTPSQSDGVNTSTVASSTNTGTTTQTGPDTKWGPSPFASGSSFSGSTDSGATVFHMPNTEWKTKTLSGITYIFGDGNPAGVAMSLDQIKEIDKICSDETNSEGQKLIATQVCSQESGTMFYVTPEVEKYLLAALSDPNWSKLATVCEKNFRFVEQSSGAFTNAQNDSEYPLFDRVFSPGWLDMDRYLYIDPNTGLKLLNRIRVNNIAGFLIDASHYGRRKDDGWINPHGDCVDQYGTEIARNLKATLDLYQSPITYVNWYTNQFILSKQFNLSQF